MDKGWSKLVLNLALSHLLSSETTGHTCDQALKDLHIPSAIIITHQLQDDVLVNNTLHLIRSRPETTVIALRNAGYSLPAPLQGKPHFIWESQGGEIPATLKPNRVHLVGGSATACLINSSRDVVCAFSSNLAQPTLDLTMHGPAIYGAFFLGLDGVGDRLGLLSQTLSPKTIRMMALAYVRNWNLFSPTPWRLRDSTDFVPDQDIEISRDDGKRINFRIESSTNN